MEARKKLLQSMPKKSVHLIVDIWTSRQQQSVFGVKVQLIHNWELKNFILGFRHFPTSHTGVNIKDKIVTLLSEQYQLSLSQVFNKNTNFGKAFANTIFNYYLFP